ncbi:MAG: HAD hydrolase-like protein [Candidatus Micrarchaeota archaeon]
MRVLIWDFDGVIVDTVQECYALMLRTIEKEKAGITKEAGLTKFPPIPFGDFEAYRSKSVNAADFFANYLLHRAGEELSEDNLEKATNEHRAFLRRMDVVFYEERERMMNEDEAAYFETLKVYPGIPDVLESLSRKGVRHAIMSARDSHSIRQILDHFSLLGHFEFIIGHEVEKGDRHVKGKQISLLKAYFSEKYANDPGGEKCAGDEKLIAGEKRYASEKHATWEKQAAKENHRLAGNGDMGPGDLRLPANIEYFFIDDIPFNLAKVGTGVVLLFAGWGYGKLKKDYVKAMEIPRPEELLGIL